MSDKQQVALAVVAVGALIALYILQRQRQKPDVTIKSTGGKWPPPTKPSRSTGGTTRPPGDETTLLPSVPVSVVVALIVPIQSLQSVNLHDGQQALRLTAEEITSLVNAAVFFGCFSPTAAHGVEGQMELEQVDKGAKEANVYLRLETQSDPDLLDQKTKWGIKKQLTKPDASPCTIVFAGSLRSTAGTEHFIYI